MTILIIFDFDSSLIPFDSDFLIIDNFAPEYSTLSIELYKDENSNFKRNWSKVINYIIKEIMITKKICLNKINELLKTMPIDQNTLNAIKLASSKDCILSIISDANEYYINTILENYNIKDLFKCISTNHSSIIIDNEDNNQERLEIKSFQSEDKPHNCPNNCPFNLCKGSVVDRYKIELLPPNTSSFDRIIYIGDGNGDYCGVKHLLSKDDIILCRKDWALHNRIKIDPTIVATVIPWVDGETIYQTFQTIFQSTTETTETILNLDSTLTEVDEIKEEKENL